MPQQVSEPRPSTNSEQVYRSGRWLFLNGQRWDPHGIQFFVPDYGINGRTLRDAEFRESGEARRFWLDTANTRLHARLLRVFIDLPGEGNNRDGQSVSHATIYTFAGEAWSRGMRLGLVLHNSADFEMTTAKANWLRSLIVCLRGGTYAVQLGCGMEDRTAVIAYVNADNEINNHPNNRADIACAPESDCYSNSAYGRAANAWVASFTRIFKEAGSPILVTVGMSSEAGGNVQDNTRHFFENYGGNQLAATVDFLSPHNYGGGAATIYDVIANTTIYTGPVLLEEYGFATDPKERLVNGQEIYQEGAPICWTDPLGNSDQCENAAPYFVELNIRELQRSAYAGGVAWMLADVSRDKANKNCGSDEPADGMLPDYFTGLFAVGGKYCAGTRTQGFGMLKATGYRVCLRHTGGQTAACPLGRIFQTMVLR